MELQIWLTVTENIKRYPNWVKVKANKFPLTQRLSYLIFKQM